MAGGIATNSDGQFIVADDEDKTIEVFDSNGNFLHSFNTCINEASEADTISGLVTDENTNIYVLESATTDLWTIVDVELEVKVFNSAAELLVKFPAESYSRRFARMAVTNNKVLVLRDTMVDEYDHKGAFFRQFDEEIFGYANDITADDDD